MVRRGRYRKYSDRYKARAIALVDSNLAHTVDAKVKAVAKTLEMPEKTLRQWVGRTDGVGGKDPLARQEMEELVQESKKELTELYQLEVQAIFKRMDTVRDEATYKELGVVAGILIDKISIANGQPTQNIQQKISFVRQGISTVPEHLTSSPIASLEGEVPF